MENNVTILVVNLQKCKDTKLEAVRGSDFLHFVSKMKIDFTPRWFGCNQAISLVAFLLKFAKRGIQDEKKVYYYITNVYLKPRSLF